MNTLICRCVVSAVRAVGAGTAGRNEAPRSARWATCYAVMLAALFAAPGTANAVLGFSSPAALNTNAGGDSGTDNTPQVTTDGAGNWVAVWSSGDILVSRSMDNGATWTAPAAIDANAAGNGGTDLDPQVTTDGAGNWVAVWWSDGNIGGTIGFDLDILVARSTDNGATWTAPVALNTNAGTDSGADFRPQVITDGAGNWVAVWESGDSLGGTIGTDLDILVARSTDNGLTWTAPAALNTNAGVVLTADVAPQVSTDGTGNWLAVWSSRDSLGVTIGVDFDILVARSTDNGATWTTSAALNTNADADSLDDLEPQVTTDGAGNWVAVWRSTDSLGGTIGTDNDILVSRSTDDGATWTDPTSLNTNAGADSGDDLKPQITTDGMGNWVGVWQSNDSLEGTIGTDNDILVSRSTDNGVTWTDPAALNTNAGADSRVDGNVSGGDGGGPQVTADGAGNWVVVWESEDPLGGTFGTDSDILVSISSSLDEVTTIISDEEIESSGSSGFIEAGDVVELTAPMGTGFQWKKDGSEVIDDPPRVTGATEQTLRFDPVVESDSGSYTVVFDDGSKAIVETPPFLLSVLPAGSLPAAGAGVLAVLCATIFAVYAIRRRRT